MRESGGFVPAGVKPLAPGLQRIGVVEAQNLDVRDQQALAAAARFGDDRVDRGAFQRGAHDGPSAQPPRRLTPLPECKSRRSSRPAAF